MKIIRIDSDDFAGQLIKVDFGDGNKLEYNVDEVKDTGIPIPAGTDYSQIKVYAAGRLYTDLLGETKLLKVADTLSLSELENYKKWQSGYYSVNTCNDWALWEDYKLVHEDEGWIIRNIKTGDTACGAGGPIGYISNDDEPPTSVSGGCDEMFKFDEDGNVYWRNEYWNNMSYANPLVFTKKDRVSLQPGDEIVLLLETRNYNGNVPSGIAPFEIIRAEIEFTEDGSCGFRDPHFKVGNVEYKVVVF